MSNDNFTLFVNYELPKRISTEESPIGVQPGLVPVTTGVGLGVEFASPDALGVRGKSAYELAVENGFEGSVEEWLASLVGGEFSSLKVGLVTAKQIPLSSEGTATLPGRPYGDIMLNMAIVHLLDGSILEVTDVSVDTANILKLNQEDWLVLSEQAVAVTVSYLGDLTPIENPM